MKREEKDVIIGEIAELLNKDPNVYITDTSALTVAKTNQLRRLCFTKGVKMLVAVAAAIEIPTGRVLIFTPMASANIERIK